MVAENEADVALFLSNVHAVLLSSGSGAARRDADAWMQGLRRGGAPALALCAAVIAKGGIGGHSTGSPMIGLQSNSDSMSLAAQIMAAQTMVAIIKKTRDAVSPERLFACMMLPAARASPPVLTQIALAIASLGAKTLLLDQEPHSSSRVLPALLEGIAQHCDPTDVLGVACLVLSSMPETLFSREVKLDRRDESRRHVLVVEAQRREWEGLCTFLHQYAAAISPLSSQFAVHLFTSPNNSALLARLDTCLGCCSAWVRCIAEAALTQQGGGGKGLAARTPDAPFLNGASTVLRSWIDDPLFQIVIPQSLLGLYASEPDAVSELMRFHGAPGGPEAVLVQRLHAWLNGEENEEEAHNLQEMDLRVFRAASEVLSAWLEGASLCVDTDLLASRVQYVAQIIQVLSFRGLSLSSRYLASARHLISGVFSGTVSPGRLETALKYWSESVDEMQELLQQIMETLVDTFSSLRYKKTPADLSSFKSLISNGLQTLRVCSINPCATFMELCAAVDTSGPTIVNGRLDLANIDVWMRLRVLLKRHQISLGSTMLSVLTVLRLCRDTVYVGSPEETRHVKNAIFEVLRLVRACSELFPDPHFLVPSHLAEAYGSAAPIPEVKLPLQLLFPQFDKHVFGWTREIKDQLVDFRNEVRGALRLLCIHSLTGRDNLPATDFVAGIVSESQIELQAGLRARGNPMETAKAFGVARAFVDSVSVSREGRDTASGHPPSVALKVPQWTRAESWVHIVTACNKGIIDSVISISASNDLNGLISWKSAVMQLIELLNEYRDQKGILRLSSLVIADLTPVLWQLSSFIETDASLHIQTLRKSAASICSSVCVPESKITHPQPDVFFGSSMYDFETLQQRVQLSFRVKQDHTGVVSVLKLADRLSPLIVAETFKSSTLPRFAVVLDDFVWGIRWCTAFISGLCSGRESTEHHSSDAEAPSETLLRNFIRLISDPELLSGTMTQKGFQILINGMIRVAVLSAFVDPWRPEGRAASAWSILFDGCHSTSSTEQNSSSSARRAFPRLLCCTLGSMLAIVAACFLHEDTSAPFDSVFGAALNNLIKTLFLQGVAASVRISLDEQVSDLLALQPGSDNAKCLDAAITELSTAFVLLGRQTSTALSTMSLRMRPEIIHSDVVTRHSYLRMLGASLTLVSNALQALISCVQQLPELEHNNKSKASQLGLKLLANSACIMESTLSGVVRALSVKNTPAFREDAFAVLLALQDTFQTLTPIGLLQCLPPITGGDGSGASGNKCMIGCCTSCPLLGPLDEIHYFGNGVFGEIKAISSLIDSLLLNHRHDSPLVCAALSFFQAGPLNVVSAWQRLIPVHDVTRHIIGIANTIERSCKRGDLDSSFFVAYMEFWNKILWLCGFSSRTDAFCSCHNRTVSYLSGWRSNTFEKIIAPSLEASGITSILDASFSNWLVSFCAAGGTFISSPVYRIDVVTSSELRSICGDMESSRHSSAALTSIPTSDEVFHACEVAISVGIQVLFGAAQSSASELSRDASLLLHSAASYLLIALGPVFLSCVRCEIDGGADFASRCVEDTLQCTMPDGSLITTFARAIQVHRVICGQVVGMQSVLAVPAVPVARSPSKAAKEDSRGTHRGGAKEEDVSIACPVDVGLGHPELSAAWLQRGTAAATFRFVWLYINVAHAFVKLSERELEDLVQLLSKLYVVFGLSRSSEFAAAASAWCRESTASMPTHATGKSLLQGREVKLIHEAVYSVGRTGSSSSSDWRKVTLVVKNLAK